MEGGEREGERGEIVRGLEGREGKSEREREREREEGRERKVGEKGRERNDGREDLQERRREGVIER